MPGVRRVGVEGRLWRMAERSVIVCPPVKREGRRVWIDGKIFGDARSLTCLAEMLRHAGWPDIDQVDVADAPFIEWHGGGPEVWTPYD